MKKETKKFTFEGLAKGQEPDAPSIIVYDEAGQPLELGAEQKLGRTGASGRVYMLPCAPAYCAKIYLPEILADEAKRQAMEARLVAMLGKGSCMRAPGLCWPLGLLRDAPGGKVIGFGMRRVPDGCRPFKALFGGPRAVQRVCPGWGRRKLALLAREFVRTLEGLARDGVEVADWNPENFAFSQDGKVYFLDCDSYSFVDFRGTRHPSDMYYPDMAAPEILRDPGLVKELRTREQTEFSAALMTYQLVQLGEHAYSFLSGEGSDAPRLGSPAENILGGRTALGRGTGLRRAPHWHALWSWLPATTQAVFLKTFREGHGCPAVRASLAELAFALEKFAYECLRTPERDSLQPAQPKQCSRPQDFPMAPDPFGAVPKAPVAAYPLQGPAAGRLRHAGGYRAPAEQAYLPFRGGYAVNG